MDVQEVKEQLKAIFRQVINNAKIDNLGTDTEEAKANNNKEQDMAILEELKKLILYKKLVTLYYSCQL